MAEDDPAVPDGRAEEAVWPNPPTYSSSSTHSSSAANTSRNFGLDEEEDVEVDGRGWCAASLRPQEDMAEVGGPNTFRDLCAVKIVVGPCRAVRREEEPLLSPKEEEVVTGSVGDPAALVAAAEEPGDEDDLISSPDSFRKALSLSRSSSTSSTSSSIVPSSNTPPPSSTNISELEERGDESDVRVDEDAAELWRV
jgi:hypothetical protein